MTRNRPPKCGSCDENRLIEVSPTAVTRCPQCHPLAPDSLTALLDRRSQLKDELRRVEDAIAAFDAPAWARGPGRPG